MEGNIVNYITQIRGVSYKPSDLHDSLNENSIILLRANNIVDGKINFEDVVYVDKSKVSETQILRENDVLICASSGSKNLVGKAASFNGNIECTFGAFCKVIRPRNILGSYLSAFFQSKYYRFHISQFANGANINNIKNEHINSFSIPERTLEEQKEISYKVFSLKRVIEKYNRELELLDELVKARFVEMFGDPIDNPMNWEKKKLKDIVTEDCTISYGIVQTGEEQKEGIPVFRPVDIVNHTPKVEELKKTTEFISDRYKKTLLKGHELLITVRANIADTFIADEEFMGCNVGRGIVPIRTQEDIMRLEFLKCLIDNKHLNDILKSKAKGITLIQLNMEDLRNVELIIPPIDLQLDYLKYSRLIDKSRSRIQKSLEASQELFDSLMQEYFG